MNKVTKKIGLFSLVFLSLWGFSAPEKVLDFDFKDMEFYKAVESIAHMDAHNVIFAKGVDNKPVNFNLSKVTPENALKILLETYGYISTVKNGVLYISTVPERVVSSTTTAVIPLVNVIAKDIENNIKPFIPTGTGQGYSINEQRNAFIISGPSDAIASVKKLIEELDQEVKQIFIEAQIIDTTTSFSRQLGIEWGNQPLRAGAAAAAAAAPAAATGAAGAIASNGNVGAGVSVSGFVKDAPFIAGLSTAITSKAQLDARITAAENNGDAKTISSPKITTLNGMPATLSSGTTITFKTLVNTGAGAQSQGTSQSLRAGLNFTVTPFIVSDNQVRLTISITKSEPGASGPDGIPTIAESSANTSLIVRNGQTASIAGLVSQTNTNNAFGVPFLSSIPIFGGLFGSLSKTKDNHELLLFMTPTIFKGSREVAALRKPDENDMNWERRPTAEEAMDRLHDRGVLSVPNKEILPAVIPPQGPTSGLGLPLSKNMETTKLADAKVLDLSKPVVPSASTAPAAVPVFAAPVEKLFQQIDSAPH